MSSITNLASLFFFFFILLSSIPSSFPLSFNLPTITTQQTNLINVTRDAYVSNQGIQVTPDERDLASGFRVGRATYMEPMHLWDRASGNLSDFSTHFSFVMNSRGRTNPGDGLAFFLAPVGSSIRNESMGRGLGLGTGNETANSTSDFFVAVEFDTYINGFDPNFTHVGIDVNSMLSVVSARWDANISGGLQNEAWITYAASSRNLTVTFTNPLISGAPQQSISYGIDLRAFLPEFVIVGFSASTGSAFETHNVKSWEFSSTTLDSSVDNNPGAETPPIHPGSGSGSEQGKGQNTGLIVGLSVGIPLIILASGFGGCFLWRRKRKTGLLEEKEDDELVDMDNEFEKGTGPKKFSYNDLFRATNNFADEEKLGEGGFGGVYRGWLRETDSYVAVKRVSQGSKQGLKEYASEVKIISQLRHRNLVQLIGWCHQKGELLLVYDFMPNGSLDFHLFKGKSLLTWEIRHKIALGLASALLYLHEEWERCVVHRDIKTSNIMLDSSFNAKLGDFGLARLIDHEKGSQTTVIAGTMGYMAPECVITGRASKETDMYSFGTVLLEIACGRRTFDQKLQQDEMRLAEWVWRLYGLGKLVDAADPKLGAEFDQREMECLMVVGLWCVHPDPNNRPSIRQALHVLNFETGLPELPPVMPVPTYFAPTIRVNENSSTVQSSTLYTDSEVYTHYSESTNVTTSSSGSSTTVLLRT